MIIKQLYLYRIEEQVNNKTVYSINITGYSSTKIKGI